MDTNFFGEINWLAVLAATLAYFILGALWYSKALFANRWIRYHNINMDDPTLKKGVAAIMTLSFVWFLVICIGLALIADRLGLTGVLPGVKLGLLTGVCFSFAAISVTYLYVKKAAGLHLIDGLYHVTGQIIAAVILCIWH
jgi:hypothetical protein